MNNKHINNNDRPLIFLGSNSNMYKYVEICEANGIEIAGIIDSDYFGNTSTLCDIQIIDTEHAFYDAEKLKYYTENFNFFCAVNWTPMLDAMSIRNKNKRKNLIAAINNFKLPCISIVAKTGYISPSVTLGKGCFIDNMVHIESKVTVDDYVSIYAKSHVGHHAHIGENCVLQRMCVAPSSSTIERDSYFSPMVKALKDGAKFGTGTFIHEGVYIRRGTVANEVVSLKGENLKRVTSALDNCL